MVQQLNQFSQAPVLGQLDLKGFGSNVMSAVVADAQAVPLIAGQPVKLGTTNGGPPQVIGLAANTDLSWGFVCYNTKDASFPADSKCEVALLNSVMYMNSGAAITRGGLVEVVYATPGNVITSGGTNPVVGFALDGATGANQLIRVYVQSPFAQVNATQNNTQKQITVPVTLAELNAGKTLIAGVAGQAITVSNYAINVAGAFITGTAAVIESTAGSPVVVSTIAQAALTDGAHLFPASASTTLGVGFAAALGTGDGLKIVHTGSSFAGGTSLSITLTYNQQ